ncbi:preprotein translocase subunit SecE [Fusibacter tunisiensis]|jgi:preprotein translocase subunit SecE|uniref:Protein translocase subunit SecE n=1 Tax=Fusibacter tunisiensis TaxID=1008308 RepID=A0ABS2MQY3_9FIRM|nr:preprotein translocase subunit SecE [Fusibacter tunisiensis]MBM7561781.1 preprotein translocase subunit SecE [Fusibacter tunisiensis]
MSSSNNVKEKKPGMGKFFKGVRSEVKKVTWPSRKDVWNYTVVVLVMVLISAVSIGVLDTIFKFFFNLLA